MSGELSNGEVLRRLGKLEDQDEKLKEAIQQLVISNTKLSLTIESMNKLEPRVRVLESEVANNKVIVSSVKWLAVTAAGSAIAITITTIGSKLLGG